MTIATDAAEDNQQQIEEEVSIAQQNPSLDVSVINQLLEAVRQEMNRQAIAQQEEMDRAEIEKYLAAAGGAQIVAQTAPISASYKAFKMMVENALPGATMFGIPSDEQMEKINAYRPAGRDRYDVSEVITVPYLACHNLLSIGRYKFDVDSLAVMAQKAAGKSFMLDHAWEDSTQCKAYIYDSVLVNTGSVAPDEILNAVDFSEVNQRILNREGFNALLLSVAVETESAIAKELGYGKVRCCSIGGLTHGYYYCGDCTEELGENVSYDDERCGHFMPAAAAYLDMSDPRVKVSSYFIKAGFHSYTELSACVLGMFPGAGMMVEG